MAFSKNSEMWIDRQLVRFPWIGWGLGVACVIFFVITLMVDRGSNGAVARGNQKNPEHAVIDLSKIGTGPLSLKGSGTSPMLIALATQLAMLGKSHLPDRLAPSVLLGISGSQEQCKLSVGEKLFLKIDENTRAVEFSALPQEVALTATAIESDKAVFTIEPCALFPQEALRTFSLKRKGALPIQHAFPPLLAFQNAIFWGPDLLIEQYGGKEFGLLKGSVKVELSDGNAPYFLYMKEGELLSWNEGRWQQRGISGGENAFAKVTAVSVQQVDVQVCEESGFNSSDVKIMRARGGPNGPQGALLTEVHRRSNSEVAASIGKKRMILKEGDWVLKGKHGWRKIGSLRGIDACLSHELRGELFIFDRIEGDQLIGNVFDEMRTSQTPIRIPLKRGKN
ncbi:MAG: hypothetical protein K940chlam2_00280 [Chlamydiae bacterium]|nr:hypothetical protein [Chlamydiota bacterium]